MKGGNSTGIIPQERDFALLRGLYESRVMTTAQAAALYFENRLPAAQKRLQKLKRAQFVRDRVRHTSDPAVIFLTKEGYETLKRHNQLAGLPLISDSQFAARCQVSSLTLRHETDVVGVKAAFMNALARYQSAQTIEFTTWPRLYQFSTHGALTGYGASRIIVKPDGFLCIHEKVEDGIDEHCFFVEIDRSSESQTVIATKAECYRNHYRSGGFAEQRGGCRAEYEQYPFRVLTVFKTANRRDNIAQRLLNMNPPVKTMVWMTTIAEALNDPLGPIWIRPVDAQHHIISKLALLPR